MKLKEEFTIREFNGTVYAVPSGPAAEHRGEPVILTDTGRILWQKLLSDTDEASLVDALTDAYDVDRAIACADVAAFLAELRAAGLTD